MLGRVQPLLIARLRARCVLDHGGAQVVTHGHAVFTNHSVGIQGLAEDVAGKAQQTLTGAVAERRRRTHAHQLPRRCAQAALQAANQACQVCALRTIEGVQFVHHQVAQRVWALLGPQAQVGRTQQQKVQHLVVGQQDVGRIVPQGSSIGDDSEGAWFVLDFLDGLRLLRGRITDIEPSAYARQSCRLDDGLGDAPRLIGGQGVHRVKDDGFDTRPPLCPCHTTVLQDGVEKALCLARPGARGHQRGASALASQALERLRLMGVGFELLRQPTERWLVLLRAGAERQGHCEVRPFEDVVASIEKALQQADEAGRSGWKRRAQEVRDTLGDLLRDDQCLHVGAALGLVKCLRPRG